ncbi:MAG: hypothetical protein E6Q95_05155 [Chitinophagaceae bacterium]|nr:MAG: hypothetical protein E6Q95_05155 [Chitinophagaceae bacterium]
MFFLLPSNLFAQVDLQKDSVDTDSIARMVVMSEVVVRKGINVPGFIQKVKDDTSFYKAFKNLRILNFSSFNNIIMKNKRGESVATLNSKTHQTVSKGCRTMRKEYEHVTGDMLSSDGTYNYYTAELYAGLFFTVGKVCGDNNIVADSRLNPKSKSGIDKRKEQLKMLFFNPGKKIPGIPLMGEKSNIFDPQNADLYDYILDFSSYGDKEAFVFTVKAKEGLSKSQRNRIVFDNMVTWFDYNNFDILSRVYDLSYNTGVYDFDVHFEVKLSRFGKYLVPTVLRYSGNWDIMFKKRERGLFTATLFDFK